MCRPIIRHKLSNEGNYEKWFNPALTFPIIREPCDFQLNFSFAQLLFYCLCSLISITSFLQESELTDKFFFYESKKYIGKMIAWICSHHLHLPISLLTIPSNVLPLHLKQIFPPMIWIFAEVEGDGIESRLPFKIFFTLHLKNA